jgi:hypothetical protein
MLITIKQDNMENSPAKQTSKITKEERRNAKAEAKHAKKGRKAVEKGNKAVEKADKMANKQSAQEANKQSAQEEKTKRIAIRQGERTRRVEARNSSPAKQVEKARMQKMKKDNSFRLGQMISNKGDTTSFEFRPTGTGENKKNIISNEEYKRRMSGSKSIAKQTGETVNTAGQVIPTGIGDAAPNNAFNASVTPPQPNRAGTPPRSTANLNMGIGVDPNTSNFKNNQASNNAALAGGGNVPGMQVPQTMAAKYGSIAKMNAGFVKLPKQVQNKILKNEN